MDRDLGSTVLHTVKRRLLTDYPGQIRICLEALDEEQLWWRPNDRSNSVANLIVHLAGSNRYYFDHVIGGRDNARDRAAEFAMRGGRTKADLQAYWDDSVRATEAALDALDPSQLMAATDRSGKTTAFVQVLLHVSHHNAVHMAQIVYIAKQQNPEAIDEIWMRMRDR